MKKIILIAGIGIGLTLGILFFVFSMMAAPSTSVVNRPNTGRPLKFTIDWSPGPEYAGYFMAQALGYYAENNLNVTIKSSGGSAMAAQFIRSGDTPLGTTSVYALVSEVYRSSGGRVLTNPIPSIVAVVIAHNPNVLITKSNLKPSRLEDLAGLKIGYPVGASETFMQFAALLKLHPELENRVTLKEVLPGGTQFKNGEIDAQVSYLMDLPAIFEASGYAYNATLFSDWGINIPNQCIAIAPGASIDPAMLKDFVKSSVEGWEYARRNPVNAAKLLDGTLADQDPVNTGIVIKYCVELLPDATGVNVVLAYTDREMIRKSVRDSLELLTASEGVTMAPEDLDRFSAAFLLPE